MAFEASPTHIFDLHCDTLDRLALSDCFPEAGFSARDGERVSSLAENDCHIDFARMAKARYAWCQCFAAFIPDHMPPSWGWQVFCTVRDYFQSQLVEHAALVEQVRDAREIDGIVASGKCAALFTVEGGSFIEGTLDRLVAADEAGVKMLTLTWNGKNAIASGNQTGDGLTEFGARVVAEMERRHMVVDVSHLNDRSFWDVLKASERPLAASHSNARAVCGHSRNLTDDMFRALAERGGIAGLNFCREFLRDDGADPTRDDVLRHVDHFLNLGGERALALGSDYDGCDVPSWLAPAENVGNLHMLFSKEFGEDIAHAICFGNAAAFFERNEEID